LACAFFLPLTLLDVVIGTLIFFVGELSLSRFPVIRDRPY
jgi:hypothetical protein